MVTLKSNTLAFAFPEHARALRARIDAHVSATVPRVMHELRQDTLSAFHSHWAFQHLLRAKTRASLERALALTADDVARVLREECLSGLNLESSRAQLGAEIEFQRTLRIPDDGNVYPLPAGLGRFPLQHIDDFADRVPEPWLRRGGVLMPMYQSEALWLNFEGNYPCAVKVAAGKINAVTGDAWTPGLQREPQNYLVLPEQPWLDGFSVGKGVIRQFVAMPLGAGFSVEEQVTGRAETGGIQLQVFPMRADAYFQKRVEPSLPCCLKDILHALVGPCADEEDDDRYASPTFLYAASPCAGAGLAEGAMGLGAGGTMRQEIYDDPNAFDDWDTDHASRCFVHLCNSMAWRAITGSNPPHPPLTAKEYKSGGIPWFDHYRDDLNALPGSKILAGVKSVAQIGHATNAAALVPEHGSMDPELIIQSGTTRRPDEVRQCPE